ncbi:MAG: M23 family metallopeptidase [Treponema sp.]|nr:M23 family metallopeptidase [Treponema sp.]
MRKFAITKATLKVLAGSLALFLSFLLLAGQGKAIAAVAEVAPEESIGGRESAVTAESVSLETEGLSEPEELNQPRMLLFSSYTFQKGDVAGEVAKQFGLSTSTLISVNGIKNTRGIQIGQTIRVPNQDGIFYSVRKGDTLELIATKHKAQVSEIKVANELFSDKINPNTSLFIPGATLPWEEEQQINGDLFAWPVRGRLSSYYGYRRSPFTGARSFHDGLDIAAPMGTPIKATMAGRVQSVGYDNVYGNFVIITHTAGYRTLYGHMNTIGTRSGAYVEVGSVIGTVGSTGQSTGPHLHFTVYKNGSSINPRSVLR